MDDHESMTASPPLSPTVLFPNGLLPGKAESVTRPLDAERWAKAEERTAKLIACIQPNPPSEDRRNAVARYVRRLIMECFPRQVEIFTFGSVPLKTYLPDGDIDLTAFSTNQNLKESWANLVRDMLEKEENNENAEFHVKEVQYIQAEVKIIKCLVENIVVDISFNQIGGLCTLCFLEEVDHYINQNHLFKRSIILIKAWCYYESRILGAHHGLISTYALETLVLYIFHVFNNSFSGPLEVLYRFLEFFSKFDWQNFCISLWGPVPVSSLPDVTAAKPPRRDVGELRVSEAFLKACSRVYAVNHAAQEIQGQPFASKHFNVIDPLRENNNLGRSVSKGNFSRIKSAFTLGAKKLSRLLDCPKENLIHEVNKFFMNTWERHGSGRRPDAPGNDLLLLSRLGDPETSSHQADKVSNSSSSKRNQDAARVGGIHGAHSMPSQQKKSVTEVAKFKTKKSPLDDKVPQTAKAEIMVNNFHGRHVFARTRSSPELTETYSEAFLQPRRTRKAPEATRVTSNLEHPADSASSVRHTPSPRSPDSSTADISSVVNGYNDDTVEHEDQDLVSSITSSVTGGQGFNGQFPFPFNGHLPFQVTPSMLASMGYGQMNVPGNNLPFIETPWSTNLVQFPQNFVSSPFTHYSPHPSKAGNDDIGSNVDETDQDLWHEQERGTRLENGGYDKHQSSRKIQSTRRDDSENSHSPVRGGSEEIAKTGSRTSSMRSRTSSESSWDGSTTKGSKSGRERRNKKVVVSGASSVSSLYGKGKSVPEHSIQVDNDNDDDNREWIPVSSNSEIQERERHRHELGQTSGSESMMSLAPFLIGPGGMQQNEIDNSGYTFYPTGPPVPIIAMLPTYNFHQQAGGNAEEGVENHHDQSETPRNDILVGDFISHWQNLQYGRTCQSSQHPPVLYHHTPIGVPPHPPHIQTRYPWDGPGRPMYTNIMNQQLVAAYGPRIVPVAHVQQHVSTRPPAIFPRYASETPRYRSGTGTYFPNPISPREQRPASGMRRGNYGHDRNNEREGSWKTRGAGRGNYNNNNHNHNHNQGDNNNKTSSRQNRPERQWGTSYRNESSSHHSRNGVYGLQHGMKQNISAEGGGPVMMFYQNDHHNNINAVYDGGAFEDHPRFRGGGSAHHMSSPEDPSSPHFPRGK